MSEDDVNGKLEEDKRGRQYVVAGNGERFDVQGYVGETRVGYMCAVDFEDELGEHAVTLDGKPEGTKVYDSLAELQQARPCTEECGWVKVMLVAVVQHIGTRGTIEIRNEPTPEGDTVATDKSPHETLRKSIQFCKKSNDKVVLSLEAAMAIVLEWDGKAAHPSLPEGIPGTNSLGTEDWLRSQARDAADPGTTDPDRAPRGSDAQGSD